MTEPATAPRSSTGTRALPVPLIAGALLALVVLALLAPFAATAPPAGLTKSNAIWTDEGFNLANARNRVLFGRFGTDDVDRSLSNGAFSGLAALVFAVTGPSIPAGRWISIVATACAVLLLAVGLARPMGTRVALLAAAALGGSQLLLQYGRLALVEPLMVALLVAALVVVARALPRPSVGAGAGAGLLLAAAISVKVIAVVPAAVLVGVPLVTAARRGRRAAVRMLLTALGVLAVAALAWGLLVALPNLDRLRIALRIWPSVHYPTDPVALVRQLAWYAADSDGALPRAAPLLAAAGVGLAVLVRSWRSLPRDRRDLLAMAALWGLGTWGAIAVGDYAPNRYIVPALPGLAVVAGFGLATLADRGGALLTRRGLLGGAAAGRAAAVALAAAVAVPGMVAHGREAAGAGGERLQTDQGALAAAVPDGAVVFGTYGPTMLFDTRARLVTPWALAGANVDRPLQRFGVTHLLSDGLDDAATAEVLASLGVGAEPLARARWGWHTLVLSRVQAGHAASTQNSLSRRPTR